LQSNGHCYSLNRCENWVLNRVDKGKIETAETKLLKKVSGVRNLTVRNELQIFDTVKSTADRKRIGRKVFHKWLMPSSSTVCDLQTCENLLRTARKEIEGRRLKMFVWLEQAFEPTSMMVMINLILVCHRLMLFWHYILIDGRLNPILLPSLEPTSTLTSAFNSTFLLFLRQIIKLMCDVWWGRKKFEEFNVKGQLRRSISCPILILIEILILLSFK
jgi:hypothetical protein